MATSSLSGAAARGFGWLASGRIANQLANLGFKILLARLLSPSEFGVVALAIAFVIFSRVVVELGFTDALVQAASLTERTRSTAFWMNATISGLLYVAGVAAAGPLAEFFDTPQLRAVVPVLALNLLLAAPQSVLLASLSRELNYRPLALGALAGTVAGGSAGVAIALSGGGVWALVAMELTRTAVMTLTLFPIVKWRPKLILDRAEARRLWSFGAYMTGVRLLNATTRNVDTVLVARGLGQAAVGMYAMAYQAVVLPLQYLSRPIGTVAFATFSRMQGAEGERARSYLVSLEAMVWAIWPAAGAAASLAPLLIPLVLGEQWAPAASVFGVLTIAALFQTLLQTAVGLLMSAGRPGVLLGMQAIQTLFVVLGVGIGVHFGVMGAATGYVLAWFAYSPFLLTAAVRAGKIPARPLWNLVGRASLAAAITVAVGGAVAILSPWSGEITSAVTGLAGLLTWVVLTPRLFPTAWRLLRALRTRTRKRRR